MPDQDTHTIAALRKRLAQSLDDVALTALALDHYPQVYDKFGRGMRTDEKITLLLDHCRRREGELDRLAQLAGLAAGPTPPADRPTPYQVPRDIPHFVGRAGELAALEAALTAGRTAAVCGLAGLGGIGKSALAAHFASLRRDRFPDGVLYASLRDLDPPAVLGVLAQAYGLDLSGALDPAARLAAVRSLLSGKQALIVLDNAEELAAVRHILPCCGDRCAVLVTTRDAALAAAVGQVVRLPVLAEEDSLRLLRAWAGEQAVDADPAAAARACELLGNLPLAVEIAAKLAGLRSWSMAELERRLRAERGRLELLALKDLAVRASFQLSYDLLDEEPRAFFAALGAFGGLSFGAEAAAAVAKVGDAAGLLAALGDRSLLWEEGAGRFRQHPLLAEYALERLREAGREEALLERHARHYAGVARAADKLYGQGGEGVLRGLALFDLEWPQIRRGQAWAAARSAEDDRAAALASDYPDACLYCLELRLPPRGRIPWLEAAAAAARRLGHRKTESWHLGNLGIAYYTLGDARRAIGYYEQALAIAREICAASRSEAERTASRYNEEPHLGNLGLAYAALGDARRAVGYYERALAIAREICAASRSEAERTAARRGEGNHLGNLGLAYAALGDARRAIDYYEQALAIDREIGDWRGEGVDLANLGNAYTDQGDARRAIDYYEQALAIAKEIGDRYNEGVDLDHLGNAYRALDNARRAIDYYEQALAVAREIGDRHGEGTRLGNLGNAYYALGDARRAIGYYEQALAVAREIGDRRNEGIWLGNLGNAYDDLGNARGAISYYERALAIAGEIGDRRGEGNHLANLGIAYKNLGDPARARELWTQALAIFEAIESPHAATVRGWLEEPGPG